jgi:hypothetical protein
VKQLWAAGILISLSILTFQTDALAQVTPRRVIIDTDPGTDDAMAIILALNSPEFKVEALTVVPGNVDAQQGLENALKIVSLAGRCDVAVAGGAQHPLNQKLITAQFWHGKNGLANVELPPSKCKADPRFGPDLIIETIHKYPHENHADSSGAADQYSAGGFERSFDCGPGREHRHHGRLDHGRKRQRRSRGEHL